MAPKLTQDQLRVFDLRVAQAMRLMLRTQPLYYFVLAQIEKIYNEKFSDAAAVTLNRRTHKIKMILNPLIMVDFTVEDLKIVFEHEVLHLAFFHLYSKNKFSSRLFNQALDYIVNDNIPDLVARYEELMSKTPSNDVLARCCLAPKIAHYPELKDVIIAKMNSFDLAEILEKHNAPEQKSFDNHEQSGEDSDENSENRHQDDNENQGQSDDKADSRIRQSAIDKLMVDAYKSALALGKQGIGNLPAEIKLRLDELTKSSTNYRLIQQLFVGSLRSPEVERTWTRRSRRYPDLVKGKRHIFHPKLVFVIDTSASMDDPKVRSAIAGEIKALSQVCKDCWIIAGDTKETFRTQVKNGRLKAELAFKGGGGTDLQFGFNFAKSLNADGVICYTDGYLPPTMNSLGIKTLFCIYPNGKDVPNHKNIKMSV